MQKGDKFKFNKKDFVNIVVDVKQNFKKQNEIYYIPNYLINTVFLSNIPYFIENETKIIKL